MRLYLYDNNVISLEKKDGYITYVTVSEHPMDDMIPHDVYLGTKCYINTCNTTNNDKDATFQFRFYAYPDSRLYTDFTSFGALIDPELIISENNNKQDFIPDISLVMACHNRRDQLEYTLETIGRSVIKNIELIIVDDNSDDVQIDINRYPFYIKLIRLTPEYKMEKRYINPAYVYNVGFNYVRGNRVIIQNPECCHFGDVMNVCMNTLNDNNYITFSCMNMIKPEFNPIMRKCTKREELDQFLLPGEFVWYNHPIHRPCGYHFLSCITKENLYKVRGFDNKYSFGCWYDDDDLVLRINYDLKLNILIMPPDEILAIHQWHPAFTFSIPDFESKRKINEDLCNALVQRYKTGTI